MRSSDWSSDVCATDLQIQTPGSQTEVALAETIASSGINARLGTADDTARLNGLLALGPVKGVPGQTYTISAPLIGTHIDMTGCTVKWKAGVSGHNLFSNPAFTAQRTVTDGALTVATDILTSATAAFTAADVGRTVCVPGAGGAPRSEEQKS